MEVYDKENDMSLVDYIECDNCHNTYLQLLTKHLKDNHTISEDICPYCNCSNGATDKYDISNRKIVKWI